MKSTQTHKPIRIAAAILGATAVATGAFGAHALEDVLTPDRLETWNTAARYQLVHAVALLAALGAAPGRLAQVAALWTIGTLIFSGSLYLLCLTGVAILGAVTPVGGVLLIAGWVTLGVPSRG
jgi:uncharacterized membrane protein YgdD (TMEM256/DUF423 family)